VGVFLKAVFLGFCIFSFDASAYPVVPDSNLTQGDLCTESDPDFDHHRYEENIPYCKRNVSWHRREKVYEAYRIPSECRNRFTIDHLIPLAVGGNNSDQNLWPEHVEVKAQRPALEIAVYRALERGEITQEEAIETILAEKLIAEIEMSLSRESKACDYPMTY